MLIGRYVRHIFEFRAVFALLLMPNRPRLDCRVSGLVAIEMYFYVFSRVLRDSKPCFVCQLVGRFVGWLVGHILLFTFLQSLA